MRKIIGPLSFLVVAIAAIGSVAAQQTIRLAPMEGQGGWYCFEAAMGKVCTTAKMDVYTPQDVDTKVANVAATVAKAVAQVNVDLAASEARNKTAMEQVRTEVRDVVVTALKGLPGQLLTDQMRVQLADDVAARLQSRLEDHWKLARQHMMDELAGKWEGRIAELERRVK